MADTKKSFAKAVKAIKNDETARYDVSRATRIAAEIMAAECGDKLALLADLAYQAYRAAR